MSENTINNVLDAYQEALQSYEQLESIFQQPKYLSDALKVPLIDICIEKIQNVANMEGVNISETDFDLDRYYALFLLRQHLLGLKHKISTSSKPLVTLKTTQPNSSTQAQKNSNELREIIERTRVLPRVKGLDDLAGLVDVKTSLTAIVVLPMHQPQLYEGQKISNSILLYGPPGTGKTQLAHALAAEASATLFSVSASDILSQYVGQTEKLVNCLFETVKEQRDSSVILFMDEIDGLCRKRNNSESEWNRRLKTELMCQLSTFENHPKVFLICATNCPWDLDPAFLRRFQRRIYVPLPTRPDRFEILRLLTKDTPLELLSNYWGELLNQTEGYSGSDLADVVRYALNIPITELINTTRWEEIGNMYQPATENSNFDRVVYSEILDLPQGSVKARQVQIRDLMTAVEVVKRTITDVTIQKYKEYITEP